MAFISTDAASSSKNEINTPTLRTIGDGDKVINKKLILLEWNIQGLFSAQPALLGNKATKPEFMDIFGSFFYFLKARTDAVVIEIRESDADVVALQEVVEQSLKDIRMQLHNEYEIFDAQDDDAGYFTAILTKKSTVRSPSSRVERFQRTKQGRNLLIVEAKFNKLDIAIFTSHLESMKSNAEVRIEQFRKIATLMHGIKSESTVIFAGDTNMLRDEFVKVCSSPTYRYLKDEVWDVWVALGSPESCRYTWDLSKNDNQVRGGKARCRFERVYMRSFDPSTNLHLRPASMRLVGTRRLNCGMFPSDHWGIVTVFSYPNPNTVMIIGLGDRRDLFN